MSGESTAKTAEKKGHFRSSVRAATKKLQKYTASQSSLTYLIY